VEQKSGGLVEEMAYTMTNVEEFGWNESLRDDRRRSTYRLREGDLKPNLNHRAKGEKA
jgi:hypothetical protein